ncbi:MAG: IS481 family transposase [Propionibacteriaceae bacterium]|jgi:transposase InsO family protein|nr:IS481 family transposase [Propionibacteriaceae bacterium]
MSIAKLVITAVIVQGLTQSEAASKYGVSKGWVSKLMARYRAEGETAFQPKSTRPHTSPNVTSDTTTTTIVTIRTDLVNRGLDAGPETIRWHLEHHHHMIVSRATIARILTREGLVAPEPRKRPKTSYTRFEAAQPNECWQSDFTHYRLTHPDGQPGPDTEILTWLDDHSRYALSVTGHIRVTAPIVLATFRHTISLYAPPASTLTDNGMVYTTRFSGGKGGRTSFEKELQKLHIIQKNGHPNHPQTQGKVERFQQTLKKWLRAQPHQPATLTELQSLLIAFTDEYNNRRPHKSLPHHQTPATRYTTGMKASPANNPPPESHNRVRYDKVDTSGRVTLRHAGQLHHIGIGRTHTGTLVTMLIQDLQITIINTATGEILRDLILDPTRDYQPHTQKQQTSEPAI